MKKIISLFFFIMAFLPSVSFAALNVQEAITSQGVKIWVVEDTMVPVLSVDFAFKGGIALEQKGKEGLTNLLSTMLTQGAGELDSTDFQKKLDDLSISMSFTSGRDSFYGSLKTLSKNKEQATDLLRFVLTAPRFDEDNMSKVKAQIIAGIEQNMQNPKWLVWRHFNAHYYKDHPYSNPGAGFIETVPTLSVDDLKTFMKENFALDTLDIVFVGDITVDEAKAMTEKLFAGFPQKSPHKNVLEVHQPSFENETVFIDFDVPQTSIVSAKTGLDNKDPDWHAALVANYLIGGGSFSSKLMEDIRVQKGLTYGISSSLNTQPLSSLFVIQTSTKSESADDMMKAIQTSLDEIAKDGFSVDAIEKAKTYLKGSLLLSLTSTDAISSALLSTKIDGFARDYLNKRNDLIGSVKQEDVRRVIHRLLSDKNFTTVMVGKKKE